MKAQGATEYLATYSWLLLIIVVVGAALYAAGVINPTAYVQKSCTGLQYFSWLDHQLTPSDIQLGLRNGIMEITIDSITVNNVPAAKLFTTGKIQPSASFTIRAIVNTSISSTYSAPVVILYNTSGIALLKDECTLSGTAAPSACTINGIQDGDETGVDCGGSCLPCISSEVICQNAQNAQLCNGLDIVYGEGYRAACCSEHSLCCS